MIKKRFDVHALRALRRERIAATEGAPGSEPRPAASEPETPEIGELVAGEGVYLGTYAPKDRDGISLSKTFNVFAAPEDLPGVHQYVGAVAEISKLKNWHGHDGEAFNND